jgi:hypothetical protein
LIKKKVGLTNLYKLGFDSFKARYEELQNLVVPYEEVLNPIKTDEIYTSYEVQLSSLKNELLLPVDIICECSRGKCTGRTVNIPRIIKHSELSGFIGNSNYSPSFIWQETIAVISDGKLIIYVNDTDGDFTIEKVRISYLRYPKPVDIQGYIHFDGTPSINQDCELSDMLTDELLELAVMELGANTSNVNAMQAAQAKSTNSEL